MSFTGLDVFDRTLQKTHIWLNDMMQELAADDKRQAPTRERAKDAFLARIAEEYRTNTPFDEEQVARATFRVLAKRVTEGEIEEVQLVLPAEIAELWPARVQA